ncbi:MAG: hypothetical protein AAF743_05785 [Planctomycetota bacterium]
MTRRNRIIRTLFTLAVLFVTLVGVRGEATNSNDVPAESVAELRRLKKLHIVRPDLIPFPIHYDVYC